MNESRSRDHTSIGRSYVRAVGIILTVFLLVGLSFLASCGSADPQALYENKCSTCHDLKIIEEANYSGSEWVDVVKDMQGMTTTISDDDAEKIAEYLKDA